MPKGIPNKRYTPEFKRTVVETMREKRRRICEVMRKFEINDHDIIKHRERIYLEEGPEGLAVERRGQKSSSRPAKLSKAVEEDLIAERPAAASRGRLPEKICKPLELQLHHPPHS